ncbi:MAG TPA: YbhB/YbcL family Raf kinase inhibitor-like protein [bacterium]
MNKIGICVLTLVLVLIAGMVHAAPKKKSMLRMQSGSFKDGGMIPGKYACDGQNSSPELSWKGAPPQTKSFAVICDDPDAPSQTWVHWVIYNIPTNTVIATNTFELLEAFPKDEKTTQGILQGVNDFKRIGYDGPCPPSGIHRYYFKLYALDSFLSLPAGESKDQLLKAMKGHLLGWTQIMGLYSK